MDKREEYVLAWGRLLSAKTEEEIIQKLLKIVKSFNVNFYKSDVLSNPYFKSLLPEITDEVLMELRGLRKSLEDEISGIEDEVDKIKKVDNKDKETIKKLKSLKVDCELLISELDDRIDELSNGLKSYLTL
jgi:peptidoglycan hydrolase CwlO-like protein